MREPRPWDEYLGTLSRAPSAGEQLSAEPAQLWSANIGRGVAGSPAIGDSVIAVQETGGRLTLLARGTGQRLWQRRLSGPGVAGPLVQSEGIIAATGGKNGAVYSVRLASGIVDWKRKIGPITDPIAASAERIFAATENGRLVALDRSGNIVWERWVQGRARTGVTITPRGLIFATDDSLYTFARDSGRLLVATPAPGTAIAPPAVAAGQLIFAFPDGFVAALDPGDLQIRWKVSTTGAVVSAPVVARDTVFAVTLDGKLWRIPLHNPESPETTELALALRASPAPVRLGVLIAAVNGEVLWLADPGKPARWRVRVDGPIEQPPLVRDGLVLVADGRGAVHAWR